MKAVCHGGHVLNVLQTGGHNGVRHGCRQALEEEALEDDTLIFLLWQEGPHVLQQLGRPAVAEAWVVQQGIALLPLGFAVVSAKMILESLLCVLVFEVD